MNLNSLIGIIIPFIGTSLGAGMVFFMKKEMGKKLTIKNLEKVLAVKLFLYQP